jgi:hypothetical protein
MRRPIPLSVSVLLSAAALLVGGCDRERSAVEIADQPASPPSAGPLRIMQITYESHPAGDNSWSHAYRTVYENGAVDGSHVSGGSDRPRVYQETGRISPDETQAIWSAADAVDLDRLRRDQYLGAFDEAYLAIRFRLSDDRTVRATWKRDEGPPTPRVAELAKLLAAVDVGAW